MNERAPRAMSIRRNATVIVAAIAGLIAGGCRREERSFRPTPAIAQPVRWISLSDLHPGPVPAMGRSGLLIEPSGPVENGYEESAYAMSEGKRLFTAYNCAGCHFHGGGGMGVPLMDDRWIYGERPEQIFATIVEGRPNGMPSWGRRIPAYQIWWLVAYVRSVGGLTGTDAAPGRDDHIEAGEPENSKSSQKPAHSGLPRSAEMPK
jgi:cytochrome c oxidase cbb3-type subunit 3